MGNKSEIEEQDGSWKKEFGHQHVEGKATFSDLGNDLNENIKINVSATFPHLRKRLWW